MHNLIVSDHVSNINFEKNDSYCMQHMSHMYTVNTRSNQKYSNNVISIEVGKITLNFHFQSQMCSEMTNEIKSALDPIPTKLCWTQFTGNLNKLLFIVSSSNSYGICSMRTAHFGFCITLFQCLGFRMCHYS